MPRNPGSTQSPQASASTNSAIRADDVDVRDLSQEPPRLSSQFAAGISREADTREKIFRAKSRRKRGCTDSIPSGYDTKRMGCRTLSDVIRQNAILDGCTLARKEDGCVYVAMQRDGAGYVKIGKTVNLLQRTGDHQGRAFGELMVIAAFHGYDELERRLHTMFWRERVWHNREQFRKSTRLMRWIEDVVRLNGRDDGLCWSCRASVIEERGRIGRDEPWEVNGMLPFEIDVEALDWSCDRKGKRSGDSLCRSFSTWFDRHTMLTEFGRSSTGYYRSRVHEDSARSFFHARSTTGWAVQLWIASLRRHSSRRDSFNELEIFANRIADSIRGYSDFRVPTEQQLSWYQKPLPVPADWSDCDLLIGDRALLVLPSMEQTDDDSFPCPDEIWYGHSKIDGSRIHRAFISAMEWARGVLFARYGIIRACWCHRDDECFDPGQFKWFIDRDSRSLSRVQERYGARSSNPADAPL